MCLQQDYEKKKDKIKCILSQNALLAFCFTVLEWKLVVKSLLYNEI